MPHLQERRWLQSEEMTTNQERVNAAIALLREGLAPFVARELKINVQEVPPDRLRRLASDPKLEQTPIDSWDVLALLKVMEATWREVFGKTLGRIERSCVSELREWRNRWAHQVEFSTEDAERTLDSAERLLKSIEAPQADEVGRIRRELRSGHMTSKSPSSRGGTGAGAKAAQNDGSGSPEEGLRAIRTEHHQSWKNLRKAVRALMDQPHESFGTPNVAASSKSTVRRMQRETGLPLEQLKYMLDSM